MKPTTTYYYLTSSKGRCGCSHGYYHKTEATSKKQIRDRFKGMGTKVEWILSEKELNEKSESFRETIISRAR